MEENALHIVITGHVDHGKSTLVGRLLHDTGSIPPERIDEIRKASSALGREMEFAHLMDNLEEERERGITIDIAKTFFSSQRRRYVIIDAPGHREFMKNMISGTTQAHAALLLVDASSGVRDQTRRHCYALSLLGIRQTAVLVNKMDLVGHSKEVFENLKNEIVRLLASVGLRPASVIPIAARTGENIVNRSEGLGWYGGPTVMEALDAFEFAEMEGKALRVPVQDILEVDGHKLAVGRVESGVLRKGMNVNVVPKKSEGRVREIRKFMEGGITEAPAGDCVGFTVEGRDLKRGDVLTAGMPPRVTSSIRANIFWMADWDLRPGMGLVFRCATQEAGGRVENILRRFDPASSDVMEDLSSIGASQIAEVEIKLDAPVAVDRFGEIEELGRFVLENEGVPVAAGIIV